MRTFFYLTVFAAAGLCLHAVAEDALTYARDIAPIIHDNCVKCHRPDGGAPFDFTDLETIQSKHKLMGYVTETKFMPPWKVTKSDYSFVNERGLTDEQITAIQTWVEAGAPMGDLSEMPEPPEFPTEWPLGPPDAVIQMEEAYSIPADGPDIYRNFVIALPQPPEGKYLKAMDYRPTADYSAHHTLIYLETTGQARKRSEQSPQPGFPEMELALFSGSRIEGWAVGSTALPWPRGVSLAVPENTDLVLQNHYHPIGKAETDQARIALYYTDEPPSREIVHLDVPFGFGLVANIDMPPGEKRYEIKDQFTIGSDVELQTFFPHAHAICTDISCEIEFPDGTRKTLIKIENWDFNWQERYQLVEPIKLPAGTTLRTTFHYDNSAENPFNPNNPPKRVTYGPDYTDEMACFTYIFIAEDEKSRDSLIASYREKTLRDIENTDLRPALPSLRHHLARELDLDDDGKVTGSDLVQLFVTRVLDDDDEEGENKGNALDNDFGLDKALGRKLAEAIIATGLENIAKMMEEQQRDKAGEGVNGSPVVE